MANVRFVTPEGRTSFMKIYEPEPNMKGDLGYGLKLLIPKSVNMNWITEKWKQACREEFNNPSPSGVRPLFSAGNPFDDKGAIMDGDWKYNNVDEDKQEMYEDYRDHWVMNFWCPANMKPKVVDENKNEILDQSDFQSGDYARVVGEISTYTHKKLRTKQVSVRFKVVQKTRDGERFGGGMSTDAALDMLPGLDGDGDMDGLI